MRESTSGRRTHEEQRRLTLLAIESSGLMLHEVWLRYFEYTGVAGQTELEAHLQGLVPLPAEQADILSHAVNELIDELPPVPRAPYSDEGILPADP
ncbi:hypothetical protein [Arthrobacter sp. B0490]|uniref:hypothetical protein n=1 Tax=Arthrobacter sp. B0490 TaxID=2058891 RepID=UPI000CE31098|nr:hypothetical protein [Arthrobacter sp. B0490]